MTLTKEKKTIQKGEKIKKEKEKDFFLMGTHLFPFLLLQILTCAHL